MKSKVLAALVLVAGMMGCRSQPPPAPGVSSGDEEADAARQFEADFQAALASDPVVRDDALEHLYIRNRAKRAFGFAWRAADALSDPVSRDEHMAKLVDAEVGVGRIADANAAAVAISSKPLRDAAREKIVTFLREAHEH